MSKIINHFKENYIGIILAIVIAIIATLISKIIPYGVISASVFALLIGIILNPIISKNDKYQGGINLASKKLLKLAIILMGISLSFKQILYVGGYSLIVMTFTLLASFGGGWLLGKIFKMDWRLSSLISAGTGICGGSAIAAISPVIKAKDSDIAYAIAATFIFDVVMIILFPIAGKAWGMSDLGFGLWAGTAVNDTSSVVAAGYSFSEIAGNYAIIVKMTRTLSIVPTVLIFSLINVHLEKKELELVTNNDCEDVQRVKMNFKKIFPWFIFGFLAMVAINSTGIFSSNTVSMISGISKFFMVMALGAIGLKTNVKEMKTSGYKPMLHGFLVSLLVVVVSFVVQMMLGQL